MTTDRPEVREIITKAVCGKGAFKYQRFIDLEVPVKQKAIQVLGNYVSNGFLVEAVPADSAVHGKSVRIKGHYDVHVWYAYDQETSAAKSTVTFTEYVPIQYIGSAQVSNQQASAKIVEKPKCRKAIVINNGDKTVIRVEIEQLMTAEVIGLTKVKVGIIPSANTASVKGQELTPPLPAVARFQPVADYSFDLKCEEDFPEDEEDDFDD